MPYFSVIIPVFNKVAFVKAAIESVFNQDYQDFELILVNDGSTDGSLDILKVFESDKCNIINQENLGVSAARNIGIIKSNGKFIAFLDADDIWEKNHLTELKKSINLFPDAGIYGNNYRINYNNRLILTTKFSEQFGKEPLIIDNFFKAALKDSPIWTSAACVPKQIFETIGMFNTSYTTGQDLDLWIRIALRHKVVFNPTTTMIYNKYIESSLSKSELNKIRLTLFSSYKNEEQNNRWLKKYLDYKRYGLALRCKINNEIDIYKQTIFQINFGNLTIKQRILLMTPRQALLLLNIIRTQIVGKNWYLRIFKG